MLQAYTYDAVRFLGGLKASIGFGNRPRHSLFAIEVLARGDRVQEMAGVTMKRRSHKHRINIFEIEQPPVVVKRLYARRHFISLLVSPRVDVSDCDKFY